MFSFVFRAFWRVFILALGAAIIYTGVTKAYPYANDRLPAFVAILVLYSLFVYVIVPLLIRLFRLVIKPDHIPLYVTTGDGWPSDPVNIAVIVTDRDHLVRRMTKAGWHVADPLTFKTGLRELLSIILNRSYPAAPLSNLYIFNRPHDIGFEIPTNPEGSARTRHHVRFWRMQEPVKFGDKHHHAYEFWMQKLQHFFGGKKELWIGAATEDIRAIDLQWHTGQLTHGSSHEADKERDFILQTLRDTGGISKVFTSEPGEQLRFRGQQVRTFYVTDGSIKVARLK